ncbi:major facilitator superfamily domain-containing protein [Ampelomyces quisqualis]|uniref:Major facilitator superfamily domain-containing protein n=1 Tax=Ampelomyces quisqualis TaxID=50730 RepID=A0A6A5QZI1_AMPQU|nr:major facilitator superfamily domain-containing protein [Ampelomyces quisqualis]
MDDLSIRRMYPEDKLTQSQLATPLSGPRVATSSTNVKNHGDDLSPNLSGRFSPTAAQRRKHESYTLTGSVFLIASNGETLKLPAPSSSPADPLSWGRWKRAGVFLTVTLFSIVSLVVAQTVGLFLRVISRDLGIDNIAPWHMEALVTAPTLFMAIGAVVWIPLTIGIGRRPVFLLASITIFLATLGASYAQNFQQLLACVSFLGLGEGFALSAALLIVIDMTFIHERPSAIAFLWSVVGLFGTGFVAIVPCASDHGQHWRPYYRYWSIPAAVSVVLVFFFFPETYFKRPAVAFDGLIVLQSATEKLTVFKDVEPCSGIYRDLPDLPTHIGFLGRFNVWRSPFASWTSMGRCYPQIALCFINPLIFWIFVAVALNYTGMMFIGSSYSRILGEAPYNLSSQALALISIASGLGGLIAYPVGVLPVQYILNHLAKRNHGVREAEHYLVGLILPVVTGAASSLIYGVAVHYSLHLGVYYLANGLNGFSWVTIAITTTMWVTEAFPRWAAPALAALSGGGFLVSFGLGFASAPWIDAHGFKLVGIELAVLQIVSGLVAVPIAFWGKSARQAMHGRWADERGGALRPL